MSCVSAPFEWRGGLNQIEGGGIEKCRVGAVFLVFCVFVCLSAASNARGSGRDLLEDRGEVDRDTGADAGGVAADTGGESLRVDTANTQKLKTG